MHQFNIYGHLGTQLYPFNINTSSPIMNTKPSSESQIITIDVLKADDLLRNSKYRYLDVRTEEEFNKGHVDFGDVLNIPNMFNTPEGRVKNPNFMEQVQQVCTKDDHLIVGCQSGVRSVYATVDLLDAGFKHVYNMGGGFLAWVQNGLPVAVVTGDTKTEFPSPTSPLPANN
ncbi:putative thiosulfate sulfurtransferase [Helianthus debilis subsp. tardiflorus]